MAIRPIIFSPVAICLLLFLTIAEGQKTKPLESNSPSCTKQNAMDLINQQILTSRTFDHAVPRIAVLIRAADLLWPHQKDKALAAFMEGFDLAVQDFKQNSELANPVSESRFLAKAAAPDQRYKVISALAQRDPVAARKLSDQLIEEDLRAAEANPTAERDQKIKNAEKLLGLAYGLAASDPEIAINFARSSLQYPATMFLASFMFEVAKTNKLMADQFYREALTAYASAPMDQFLYLSAYPFGNTRDAGEMSSNMYYRIPEGFKTENALQRLFVQRLLGRVQSALGTPVETGPTARFSDPAQMWLALTRLENQIRENLPDLIGPSHQASDKLFALLTPVSQQSVRTLITNETLRTNSFDELVEAAEKLADVDRRDSKLMFAVLGSSKDETVDRVLSVIEEISDAGVRAALTNRFYFTRSQTLTRDKNFAEARKIASRVTELDQRAYLFAQIAEGLLKESEDQIQAREMLNEIADATARAPKTIVTARTSLALAFLYSKIDTNRGIEELAKAVRIINDLENPDFSQQYLFTRIEGKSFASYAAYSAPGFNPETGFLEISQLDFDGTLSQAANFTDKSLRSSTIMAVVKPCLIRTPKTRTTKAKP